MLLCVRWLKYWIVFFFAVLARHFFLMPLVENLPLAYHLELLILMWLQVPDFPHQPSVNLSLKLFARLETAAVSATNAIAAWAHAPASTTAATTAAMTSSTPTTTTTSTTRHGSSGGEEEEESVFSGSVGDGLGSSSSGSGSVPRRRVVARTQS
eukprot:gnl/Spiro4/4609_TR2303_c0_g2_i1.p2 gnl/Spiro4/4609_TR2303_c0_g2~~gnl/Spiro4/4609_TR2303_c0_g2_i1.p2  ORF type:complete len:154 (+),score=35.99 gnl/Spiro4/4609_TR2303_c0_g2_i1:1052-1513(+)